jgi:hypothetical protein
MLPPAELSRLLEESSRFPFHPERHHEDTRRVSSSSSNALEIELIEPNRFQWGPKFIGDGERYDTITDVVLLNDHLLVTAHRQDALLYLIHFDLPPLNDVVGGGDSKAGYQILDVHEVYENKTHKHHHPDLMKIDKNGVIYSTFFSNVIGAFMVNETSKALTNLDYVRIRRDLVSQRMGYHGMTPHPTHPRYIFLTSAGPIKPGIFLVDMEAPERSPMLLNVPTLKNWNVKDVHFIGTNMLVALFCNGAPQFSSNEKTFYDSRVAVFELLSFPPTVADAEEGEQEKKQSNAPPSLILIDSIELPHSQVDSCTTLRDSSILVTQQDRTQGGRLLKFDFDREMRKLKLVHIFPTDGFLHGIANRDGVLAYTAYSTSKVFIHREEDYAARTTNIEEVRKGDDE